MLSRKRKAELAFNASKMAAWATKRLKTRQMGLRSKSLGSVIPRPIGRTTQPGTPKKVWLTYSITIANTAANPGFATYQFKANDPYRPDALNAISPLGWSSYGGIYNYAKVLGCRISVEGAFSSANFSGIYGISWSDANQPPTIGSATAAGYSLNPFVTSNTVPPKIAIGGVKTCYLTKYLRTIDVLHEADETQDATTVAGGGAASPTSLWYFNLMIQPLAAAASTAICRVTLKQLVQFYDCTVV